MKLLALLVTTLLVLPATSAASIVVRDSRARFVFFSGATCGSASTRTVSLPAGAFRVAPTALSINTVLRSLDDDFTPVARITAVTVGPGSVAWTATGSDAECTDPLYAGEPWESSGDDIGASYSRRVTRLYVPALCEGPRYRPRSIVIACGDGNFRLQRLRWRGWNGRHAHARGLAVGNDCNPFCAAGHFHSAAVRITLSRPRLCRGVYQYMRLRYRLVRRTPGFNRSGGTSFDWTCSA
jgi:hypothetical protein